MSDANDIEAGHIMLTSKNEYMTFSCIMEMQVMCPGDCCSIKTS